MEGKRLWFVVSLIVCLWGNSQLKGADCQLTDPSEVEALDDIKNSLIDPSENLRGWDRGDPCTSNWTGVLCFNTSLDDGYLHVKELLLLNMNLSGNLSPEIGRLSHLQILDFMWNNITGTIPKEIGNIKTLQLLLLNGNQLTGTLPAEIGYLPNLDRIQIDQNFISGSIPTSFANLTKAKHFHMNNNSLSGQIPPALSTLPILVHLLLDNNKLSGYIPPELSRMPQLRILQLDNNLFDGSPIPASFGNMSHLSKLSLRNCGLTGPMPNLSGIPGLNYLDLSLNQLNGSIPPDKMSDNITTIDLSYNRLTGSIPASFSNLPRLQKFLPVITGVRLHDTIRPPYPTFAGASLEALGNVDVECSVDAVFDVESLANNSLGGSVPTTIWQNRTLNSSERLFMDFRNNLLSNISGIPVVPPNVTVWLEGNPICLNSNLVQFCESQGQYVSNLLSEGNSSTCEPQSCPSPYEYAPPSGVPCFCAAPLLVGSRLKSPGFSDFLPYMSSFETYLTEGLRLNLDQLKIDSFAWQEGPRLRMYLKLFPVYVLGSGNKFNASEVLRIRSMFTGWRIPENDLFGPQELLNFTLLDPYKDVILPSPSSGLSKGALAGIIVGAIAASVVVSACVSLFVVRIYTKRYRTISKRRQSSKISIKIDGVKEFTYEEMTQTTKNFDDSSEVGRGGYGKVYKGILADGTAVAIKRAEETSLQGEKEFLTEIELLSRLHHRNLVTLLGYCDEEGEQMLVYEYMPNGTLRDHLSGKFKETLTFALRLRVALGSAKGILYLHTEADPPIFHRDIKATNILLDAKYTAKVADFGLSRLAPVPEIGGNIPDHVSTVVKGTPGYLDPEYFLTHKLTDKSDVYSLGVVFLELLTGKHPISHGKNLVREVNMQYRSGKIFSVIDERMGSYPSDAVVKFITLALKCCQDETDARPSMSEVVRELESIWHMMPESDTRIAESYSSGSQIVPAPSSLEMMRNPYSLSDISGGDLLSGVTPTIVPR